GRIRMTAQGAGHPADGAVLLPETTALVGIGQYLVGRRCWHPTAPPRRHACPGVPPVPDASGPVWARRPRLSSRSPTTLHCRCTTRWRPCGGWVLRGRPPDR